MTRPSSPERTPPVRTSSGARGTFSSRPSSDRQPSAPAGASRRAATTRRSSPPCEEMLRADAEPHRLLDGRSWPRPIGWRPGTVRRTLPHHRADRPRRHGRGVSRPRYARSAATSRSRFSHSAEPALAPRARRLGSRVSGGKRRCWPPSTIRTSRRSTASRKPTASTRSSSSWSRGRRWRIASRPGPIPLEEVVAIARQIADRPGGGARAGHRPSRSEAGEHQAATGRHGEAARLRAGQSACSRMPWPATRDGRARPSRVRL